MKKLLLLIIVVIILLFISAYLFFPKVVIASNTEKISCKISTLNRFFINQDNWQKWWPGSVIHDSVSNKPIFVYKDFQNTISNINYNAVSINISGNDLVVNSKIFIIPVNIDTVQIEWKYSLETNSNPINRINLFLQTRKINSDIMAILKQTKSFFEKTETVYGLIIDQIQVKDTLLVSSKFSSSEYPSTSRIYNAIDSLKNYITVNRAKEMNFPMLHIWKDSGVFKTTLAIPVNVRVPENNGFSIKKMVPGKILVSQVTGGAKTADDALNQLGLFMTENHLSSPAIPFESLITNRMEEKDSSKWITKLYYPVF